MDRNDVMTVIGIGCLAGGLWMIYPPAALIGLGLALIGIGLTGAWTAAIERVKKQDEQPGRIPSAPTKRTGK